MKLVRRHSSRLLTINRFCVSNLSKIAFSSKMSKLQSNEQVLSEPYPSFLSSLDPKSSLIQQRRHILDSIQNTNHSNNVISIIRKTFQDQPDLLNPAIFTVAVKKCNDLHQPLQCIYLMDLMYDYNIRRDLIQYNMVLLSLSKCQDQIDQSMKYFKKMVKTDKLMPDIYTLTHLMQSFRHNSMSFTIADSQNDTKIKESEKMIKKCEKIWNALVHKFKITPDRLALSEKALLYANYHKPEMALKIWDEMLNIYQVKPRVTTCGLIIKAFSKYGDYQSCEKILGFMKRNHMRMNPVILCSLMNCFMNDGSTTKAIEIFDKYVIHNRNKRDFVDIEDMIVDGNDILFGLKARCMVTLLEEAIENEQDEMIKYYTNQILETLPYQRTECGLKVTDLTLAELQLKTKLMVNGYDYDDPELKRFFEQKMKDKSLWCIRKNHHKDSQKLLEISDVKEQDDLLVQVHLYSTETAKFVLKYVFMNKLQDGTFKSKIIPIVIGKNLRFEDVRNVLLSTKLPFGDIRLDPHNAGLVLFEPF